MKALSPDLRLRIFNARQAGDSTSEVAERFDVSPAFVRRLLQRHRETGSLEPDTSPRGPQPSLIVHADAMREAMAQSPDLTAAELRDRLKLKVSALTVWRMLRRLGLSRKKSRSTPPSNTVPTFKKNASPGRLSSAKFQPNT